MTTEDLEAAAKTITDLRCTIEQMGDVLAAHNIPPIPPAHLQERVVGGYFRDFMRSGARSVAVFDAILGKHGRSIATSSEILDFGVGCGRVIRAIRQQYPTGLNLTGIDIDLEAITWLQENYAAIGRFVHAPHTPPTPLSSDQFDLVYGISVFTHLPEDMQFAWLAELRRVAAPGGILLLSVRDRPELGAGFKFVAGDETDGLPSFYRTTYHSEDYVRNVWSEFFEVLSFDAGALLDAKQDLVVCRKRR